MTSTRLDWDEELCGVCDIPRCMLPNVRCRQQHGVRTADAQSAGLGVEIPDRGRGGRPAGRPVRPGVLRAGRGQKYLRHGLLPAR
ncbi:MAG: hypothetical protein ACLSHG_02765 [Oscillospiraceae bacterium]